MAATGQRSARCRSRQSWPTQRTGSVPGPPPSLWSPLWFGSQCLGGTPQIQETLQKKKIKLFHSLGYLIHMYMSFITSFAFYFLSEKLGTVSENYQDCCLKSVIMTCSKDCGKTSKTDPEGKMALGFICFYLPLFGMKEMLELSEHVVMLVSWDASDASSPSRLITSGSCKRYQFTWNTHTMQRTSSYEM